MMPLLAPHPAAPRASGHQRAVSAATIRAYRDTWRLFLAFLSERENVPAHKLEPTTSTQLR
jgi:hypothetical protein